MGWRDKQVNTGNHSSPEQKFISRNLHRNQCHGETESEVAQSCLTLRDPMDFSPPGSSAHGIFQAKVLEWVAVAFSGLQQLHYVCPTTVYWMCGGQTACPLSSRFLK